MMTSPKLASQLILLISIFLLSVVSSNVRAQAQSTATPIEHVVAGNTQFALKFYQALRATTQGNLVFSPYSISQALAMVYAGARGNTERQMHDVLALSLPQADLPAAYFALQSDLVARGNTAENTTPAATSFAPFATATAAAGIPPRSLRIANALWGEKTLAFDKGFLALLDANYGAGFQLADFVAAPENARQAINAWIAKETQDRIQNIVPPGAINTSTRLVLTGALYFKNSWQYPFDPNATANQPFTLLNGQTVSVPMMSQPHSEAFGYFRGDGYQAVDLPYTGNFGTMLIVLPDRSQFETVEGKLNTQLWATVTASLTPTILKLSMPHFQFDFASELSAPLITLGMTDAFDPNADFTGMGPHGLFISSILHKAFISVDEKGTEAAAATVIMLPVTGGGLPPPELTIDRPFIFAIRDLRTGSILFMGQVLDPAG